MGVPVMAGSGHTIDVRNLPGGIYLILVEGKSLKFLKL